jgi:hypothetical protein
MPEEIEFNENDLDKNEISLRRIISGRICKSSRLAYEKKANKLNLWFRSAATITNHHHPVPDEMFDIASNSLVIPIQDVHLDHIFYYVNESSTSTSADGIVTSKSVSTVEGYFSAIAFMYSEKKALFSTQLMLRRREYMTGYKNDIAVQKQNGTYKMQEGKLPINFSPYIMFAKLALKPDINMPKNVIAHTYFVFQWNLMERVGNIGTITYDMLRWEGDCLVVHVPRHKGNQQGSNMIDKHVYCNPFNPAICPIVALAIIILSTSNRIAGDIGCNLLFPGGAEDTYVKWLKLLKNNLNAQQKLQLEIDPSEIGTHSTRKGAASYANGLIGAPNTVATNLRLGHSLGKVSQQYLFAGTGQDQQLGRLLAGLEHQSINFSALPPRFKRSFMFEESELEEYVPIWPHVGVKFRSVIPYLIASFVHHYDWLVANVRSDHPVFHSALVISGRISALKENILLGHMHCADYNMIATGIPEMVHVRNDSAKVLKELNDLKVTVEDLNAERKQSQDTLHRLTDVIFTICLQQNNISNMSSPSVMVPIEVDYSVFQDRINAMVDNRISSHISSNISLPIVPASTEVENDVAPVIELHFPQDILLPP